MQIFRRLFGGNDKMYNLTTFFDVSFYGVIGDGMTDNTDAIAEIVRKIDEKGGGTLYFPPGEYVTGTIKLKSNMTLYLEGGAVILGSENTKKFPMITKEMLPGYTREGHSAIIQAVHAKNVTITGRGTINGRGQYWWEHHKNDHRPRTIQTILCENVHISGITITNSPMWTIHPICCSNVTIEGITIKNPSDSPNTDGINPESCSNVHISNCHIDVGDDCIAIKSGTEEDLLQKEYPCKNITITNCTMLNGHGGIVIGSEMSGGVRNVVISNCVFDGTDRGIRIKTRRKRGGIVEDILINNILMTDVIVPFAMNGYYQCGAQEGDMSLFSLEKLPVSDDTPIIRNISITNIRAKNVLASAGYLYGIPERPIEGLLFENIHIEMKETKNELRDKPIMAFHVKKTKGEGFYCAHIKDSIFSNILIKTIKGPVFIIENSENINISNLTGESKDKDFQLIKTSNVINVITDHMNTSENMVTK